MVTIIFDARLSKSFRKKSIWTQKALVESVHAQRMLLRVDVFALLPAGACVCAEPSKERTHICLVDEDLEQIVLTQKKKKEENQQSGYAGLRFSSYVREKTRYNHIQGQI
jgi:hypothetical protein